MLTLRAVTPALAAALVVVPAASAASPATTPSALTVKAFTGPATVVSGDLLSVRATIGNRGTRAGGHTPTSSSSRGRRSGAWHESWSGPSSPIAARPSR